VVIKIRKDGNENGNGTIHIAGMRRSWNSLDFEPAWSRSLD